MNPVEPMKKKSMRLANRTKEVEFFEQMLLGQISNRILLIQAGSGMGKTSLLFEFSSICPVQAEAVLLADVELKSATTGIPYVFSRLQRQLGEDNFSQFNNAIDSFLSAGVEVTSNRLEGNGNKIQVALNAESDVSRNIRFNKLQEAFFRDLLTIKKTIVILFDTFDLAPEVVADWIGGVFLTEVADAKNIRVVIAGQTVPKPTIDWMKISETHCLDKIYDIDAWYLYAKARGLPFEREAVKAFIRCLNGQPAMIMQVLESHAGGWENE